MVNKWMMASGRKVKFSRMLMDVVNVYQAYLAQNIKKFGLGLSEYPILIYLHYRQSPDNPVCQNDIANSLKRDKALIARATRTLESKGYIISKTDAANKSKKNLALTVKGQQIMPSILETIEQWEDTVLYDNDNDLREFTKVFEMVYEVSEKLFYNKER